MTESNKIPPTLQNGRHYLHSEPVRRSSLQSALRQVVGMVIVPHEEATMQMVRWQHLLLIALGCIFAAAAATLLVGKLFFGWQVDGEALILFLLIWLPAIVPLIEKIKYKDVEIDLIRKVKKVESEIAEIVNNQEITKEIQKTQINVDPYSIRLRYRPERVESNVYRVKTYVEAPTAFMEEVAKVVYRCDSLQCSGEATIAPFEHIFTCGAGSFTIKGELKLKNGDTLRRQKFVDTRIALQEP